ncbi:MAG: hypothetical protein JO117_00150 [Verrucomicrobia bacterium]|nr:hypothetical protein [Verrucomicrobiota bacterium]
MNFRPHVLWRAALKSLLACRTPREFIRVAWRSAAELVLLAGYVPVWLWRYRKKIS